MKLKALYTASIAETISWIGLITGMIADYGFGNHAITGAFGPIHGFLFLAYVACALLCHVEYKWPIKRTLIVLLAAIPPFAGLLVVHGIIKQTDGEQQRMTLAS